MFCLELLDMLNYWLWARSFALNFYIVKPFWYIVSFYFPQYLIWIFYKYRLFFTNFIRKFHNFDYRGLSPGFLFVRTFWKFANKTSEWRLWKLLGNIFLTWNNFCSASIISCNTRKKLIHSQLYNEYWFNTVLITLIRFFTSWWDFLLFLCNLFWLLIELFYSQGNRKEEFYISNSLSFS